MNALMLTLAVRLGGGRLMPVRMLLAAAAGAAIAQMAQGLARVQTMQLWLPTTMLMMRIAKGKHCRLIADALLLLCAAGLAGGMVLALWGATGSLALAYALAGIAAVCIGMCAVRKRQAIPQAAPVRILCRYRGREAAFDAMIDSGNIPSQYTESQLAQLVFNNRLDAGLTIFFMVVVVVLALFSIKTALAALKEPKPTAKETPYEPMPENVEEIVAQAKGAH